MGLQVKAASPNQAKFPNDALGVLKPDQLDDVRICVCRRDLGQHLSRGNMHRFPGAVANVSRNSQNNTPP